MGVKRSILQRFLQNARKRRRQSEPDEKITGGDKEKLMLAAVTSAAPEHDQTVDQKNSSTALSAPVIADVRIDTAIQEGWSCTACTLQNKDNNRRCVVCGARRPVIGLHSLDDSSNCNSHNSPKTISTRRNNQNDLQGYDVENREESMAQVVRQQAGVVSVTDMDVNESSAKSSNNTKEGTPERSMSRRDASNQPHPQLDGELRSNLEFIQKCNSELQEKARKVEIENKELRLFLQQVLIEFEGVLNTLEEQSACFVNQQNMITDVISGNQHNHVKAKAMIDRLKVLSRPNNLDENNDEGKTSNQRDCKVSFPFHAQSSRSTLQEDSIHGSMLGTQPAPAGACMNRCGSVETSHKFDTCNELALMKHPTQSECSQLSCSQTIDANDCSVKEGHHESAGLQNRRITVERKANSDSPMPQQNSDECLACSPSAAKPFDNSTNKKTTIISPGWISNKRARRFVREINATSEEEQHHRADPTNAQTNRRPCTKRDSIWDDSQEPNFAYQETVRGKAARAKLPCHDCPDCKRFYQVLQDTGHQVPTEEKQFSRHRAKYKPPETPEDFWEIEFIDELRKTKQHDRSSDTSMPN